jgi:guanine deaminase
MKQQYMQKAILLAKDCMSRVDGGPFGAVIVKDNKIIGNGSNGVTTYHDPTAHAEISAIRDACNNLQTHDLSGCDIYTSCEPCPMCLGAIYWARISKIYYGANRLDAAKAGFDDQYFYDEVSKAIEQRAIPMVQCDRDDAVAVFGEWLKKDDKVMY